MCLGFVGAMVSCLRTALVSPEPTRALWRRQLSSAGVASPPLVKLVVTMTNISWITRSRDAGAAALENRTRILVVAQEPGTGGACAYCHKPIEPTAIEHRVEAVVLGGVRTLHFHRVCQHLWESHEHQI